MDLLNAYAGEGSDSEHEDPLSSPTPPAEKREVVTGTIEVLQFSDEHFSQMERAFRNSKPAPAANPSLTSREARRSTKPTSDAETKKPSKRDHSPSQPSLIAKSDRPTQKRPRKVSENQDLPRSTFHLSDTYDYQNRSWHHPSPSTRTFADLETYTPFIPKRAIHTLHAHNQGTSVARFSPGHGNLLLTAGLDGHARVWLTNTAQVARTYMGHTKGIRHAAFAPSGTNFASASYDGNVLTWDVETGSVLTRASMASNPYCLAFSPSTNELLVGCADRKVVQLDLRTAEVVQTYDQHMGAVNSISFVDSGRRFISSADDKVLRVWEYGVPVVIKYLTDPTAHSMPVTLVHPNQKSFACQAMDNTIRVFAARDKFRKNDKRVFRGHLVAGYACGISFSPDGRFLASGDSMGRMFFWDWKTSRLFRAVQAHSAVCIGVDWHPTNPSLLASCSWDGTVKLWD